jgi:hypothetical protein
MSSRKFIQTSYGLLDSQKLDVSSTAAVRSSQFTDHIDLYRIVSDVPIYFAAGSSTVSASSTGASDSRYLPANLVEYVNSNKRYFSVLADSSSGSVNITEVTQ